VTETTEWKPDVCLYHKSCDDGFAAAWCCWKRWGDAVEYVPINYGEPVPDLTDKHVLMVDFSLKRKAMLEAAKVAKSIVVLDHHETAQAELEMWTLPIAPTIITYMAEVLDDIRARRPAETIVAQFDMGKSGARLAWEFCHPGKPMPRLLAHIEDRDLWRYKLDGTRAVTAAIRSHEYSFHRFDLWSSDQDQLLGLMLEGSAILRMHEKIVADLVAHAYMAQVAGYTVPVVNVPPRQYASDCGHALLKKYPEAPFAATWVRSADGKILWSLRSEDGRENVAEIAAKHGGGGHRNAAGFSKPIAVGTP
jgi:oligoribonuclease NrnB/cAMP/cGMP phosphodiesterase (DHH superfamily)